LVPETIRNNPIHVGNEDEVRYHVCWLKLLQEVITCLPDYLSGKKTCVCRDNCVRHGKRLAAASSEHVLQHVHAVLLDCVHANVGLGPELDISVQRRVLVHLLSFDVFVHRVRADP